MGKFNFTDIPKYGRLGRDRLPDLCPHCNHKIIPEELDYALTHNGYEARTLHLESALKCSNNDCGHLFIATYAIQEIPQEEQSLAAGLGSLVPALKWHLALVGTYPTYIKCSTFSEEIQNLSPNFIEIFNQSEEAEARGLMQICGDRLSQSTRILN